jgi:hypothetical protein
MMHVPDYMRLCSDILLTENPAGSSMTAGCITRGDLVALFQIKHGNMMYEKIIAITKR